MTFDFTTQMTLSRLLPMPMNKKVKRPQYIPKF